MLKLQDIAEIQLPCYLYSGKLLDKQFHKLRSALPDNFRIYYSLKANSNFALVQRLLSHNCFLDIASSGELKIAMNSKAKGEQLEFTGPGKSFDELSIAISHQVSPIVVESEQELALLNQIAQTQGTEAKVALRINLKETITPAGKKVQNQFSQFGIAEEDIDSSLIKLEKFKNLQLIGLHNYTHSQYLNHQALCANFENTYIALKKIAHKNSSNLQLLNLGGGFGIPYFENTIELELAPLKETFTQIAQDMFHDSSLQQTLPCIEAGRYLVGPAGFYLARVNYTKTVRGKKIAILNGGFSHNMAACGFGQLLKRNYRLEVIGKVDGPKEEITLVGPSCYTQDILATNVIISAIEPGDVICFYNSGSYGASFSPSNFLGLNPAQEYFQAGP